MCATAALSRTQTNSACAPEPLTPKTRSPASNLETAAPTASTSPANSVPGILYLGRRRPVKYRERNGFPLREEALYALVAGVPTEPVQPSQPPPPRRRFFPAASPWPILLAVLLLVGGLGAGYAFSRSNRRHVSGQTPAAAAPNPPPVAPTPPPPPSPTGQGAAAPTATPTEVSVPRVIGDSLPRA